MTHGFGQSYVNVEALAQNLAKNCMVALVFNYFGHGRDREIDTRFDFYTTGECDQLPSVITELKRGPTYTGGGANDLDLVDDTRLGMLGESRGGIAIWMMLADPAHRKASAETLHDPV